VLRNIQKNGPIDPEILWNVVIFMNHTYRPLRIIMEVKRLG